MPVESRGDVVAVSRYLTYAIGEKVCYGKWGEGDYATGKPDGGYQCRSKKQISGHPEKWSHRCRDPSTWRASSPLLEQHWGLVQSGAPGTAVQYCQCFVFSGVLTTIGRSLGLATRSVTNFQSAHDVNSDRGVSKFFYSTPTGIWEPVDFPDELCPAWCQRASSAKRKKCDLKACDTPLRTGKGFSGKCKKCMPCVPCGSRDDSIWSFHVWNEMYFSRGEEQTNGWQAVDSTPQELSNGKFQMGPASVKEVQRGESDCYDTDFVIGEVNGDIKLFVYDVKDLNDATKIDALEKGKFVLHEGDPLYLGLRWYTDPFGDIYNTVGFKAVTKKPGTITRKCLKNPHKCQREELDLTPLYKRCPDAQARHDAICAAGTRDSDKRLCADPGTPGSFLEREAVQLEDANRSIHELTGGDVEAKFDDFVPKSIELNTPLPMRIKLANRGAEKRTVNIAITALGMDYRGMPVIHMETRRKKYAMKLPLDGEKTLLQRSVALEPYESHVFEHVVAAENLDEHLLESLEVNAAEGNFFLQFHVPKTFNEMFLFNAAVMGFASSAWMQMVLDQFDDIVCNVANSYRLQEECDVLTLVLAKHRGPIKLPEFKAVMLASLRSLLPKDWDSTHEVAWNWLWENVERILRTQINPKAYEEALARFMQSMDESDLMSLRQGIYKEFFAVAPAGQDYFKQSTTRLYFISDKVMETTCLLYRDPRNMVEEISGLGLRHVAYEIPTELFSPFVSSAVKVLGDMTTVARPAEFL
eukprot:symbB.v1.2.022434.t1/scaffold1980.1/size93873/12